MKEKNGLFFNSFLLILISNGFIFLRSGYEKLEGGQFVSSLPQTLTKFSSKNPYPLFKSFLENTAIPNSTTLGYLTMYGEIFAGLSIILCSLYLLITKKLTKHVLFILLLGLLTGAFLNAIFWLAAGWTSPSTDGLNLIMFITQVIGSLTILKLLLKI